VIGFRSRRETIGRLVPAVGGGVPRRQDVALADKDLQPMLELAKRFAELGLRAVSQRNESSGIPESGYS